jgi:hypothetical protein
LAINRLSEIQRVGKYKISLGNNIICTFSKKGIFLSPKTGEAKTTTRKVAARYVKQSKRKCEE